MENSFRGSIYQLRQSQISSLPFEVVKVLSKPNGELLTRGIEGWYVIVPLPLRLIDMPFSDAFNILFDIVASKGFTYLMLVYGKRPD